MRPNRGAWTLGLLLGLGLLVRLPFLATDYRNSVDVEGYRHWGEAVNTRGIAAIYDEPGVTYPPLLLYWFGFAASVAGDERALNALIKLPMVVADLLTAALLAWAAGQRAAPEKERRGPLLACALYLFNPALWYVSAYWGQTDSVYTHFLVGVVLMLAEGHYLPAWVGWALGLATKLQSIALLPLLAVVTLRHGAAALMRGGAVAAVVGATLAAPWLLVGRAGELARASLTPSPGPSVVVSAFNGWYLLLGGQAHNVSSHLRPFGLPVTYQQIGVVLFGAFALLVTIFVWRQGARWLALPAALLGLGLFMLLTEIHERYLFPVLPFLLLAAIRGEGQAGRGWNRGLVLVYGLLSLTFLFNLVTIAPPPGTLGINLVEAGAETGFLAALKGLALVTAGVHLGVMLWLVWLIARGAAREV